MFFDIGVGEVLLIAVLALLVFGPDRLPKVAADAARVLRQVREMASAARQELSDAAGLKDEDVSGAVSALRDLDPRRALLGTDPARPAAGSSVAAGAGPVTATGPSDPPVGRHSKAPGSAGPAAPRSAPSAAAGSSAGGSPSGSPAVPAAEPAPAADPDWT